MISNGLIRKIIREFQRRPVLWWPNRDDIIKFIDNNPDVIKIDQLNGNITNMDETIDAIAEFYEDKDIENSVY